MTNSGLGKRDIKCRPYIFKATDTELKSWFRYSPDAAKLKNKLVVAYPAFHANPGKIYVSGYGPKEHPEDRLYHFCTPYRFLFPVQQVDAYIIPAESDGVYQKVYVHTMYMDSVALIEHEDGQTEYVDVETLQWDQPAVGASQPVQCSCNIQTLLVQGCQCGGN
jgi:hypothetical protein